MFFLYLFLEHWDYHENCFCCETNDMLSVEHVGTPWLISRVSVCTSTLAIPRDIGHFFTSARQSSCSLFQVSYSRFCADVALLISSGLLSLKNKRVDLKLLVRTPGFPPWQLMQRLRRVIVGIPSEMSAGPNGSYGLKYPVNSEPASKR